ncbi:putative non-specific serine/threonine protein kinase [Helianthus annuus]|nr:putative non-specific serine/threonine protein kinase [Helianthus annuus]
MRRRFTACSCTETISPATFRCQFCNPNRLQNVDLSHNSLSGTLQKYLGNCRQLQRLILAGNNFSGEVPAGIFPALANLIQLDLSSNAFNGSLPYDIGQLKSLSGTLNLSFNHFTGKLPPSLGELPLTVSFDLRHKQFHGRNTANRFVCEPRPNGVFKQSVVVRFSVAEKLAKTTVRRRLHGNSEFNARG